MSPGAVWVKMYRSELTPLNYRFLPFTQWNGRSFLSALIFIKPCVSFVCADGNTSLRFINHALLALSSRLLSSVPSKRHHRKAYSSQWAGSKQRECSGPSALRSLWNKGWGRSICVRGRTAALHHVSGALGLKGLDYTHWGPTGQWIRSLLCYHKSTD